MTDFHDSMTDDDTTPPVSVLDDRFLDSLLIDVYRPSPQATEQRVQSAMAAIRNESVQPRRTARPSRRSVLSWRTVTIASVLLLFVMAFRPKIQNTQTALATVTKSQSVIDSGAPRRYAIEESHGAGKLRPAGQLDVAGPHQFVYVRPAPVGGQMHLGGNESQIWLVPPVGPALRGDPALLDSWLSRWRVNAVPLLHLSQLLGMLADRYELESLPDVELDLPEQGRTVLCRHVRGVIDADFPQWPRTIELWVDAKSDVALQLELNWNPGQNLRNVTQVRFSLSGKTDLPKSWFQLESHLPEGRRILGSGE